MGRTLVIASNPDPFSLTVTVASAFAIGSQDAGNSALLVNISTDGFDPVFNMADKDHYENGSDMPADVVAYQKALEEADVIAFVTPVYWYTMSATMKGFFDRVLCRDFAYDAKTQKPKALAGKTARLILLSGGPEKWYRDTGLAEALEKQIIVNTFRRYCGMTDSKLLFVDRTSGQDEDHLKQCVVDARAWGKQATESSSSRLAA